MIEKFISENLLNKDIEIYFGGGASERLRGTVIGSADGVLILEYKGRRDYINADKILAAWEV